MPFPLFFCIALIASLTLAPTAQARTIKVGVASAVIPQAKKGMRPDRLETITIGDQLNHNMHIETSTNGRTQVLFIDGSTMNVAPNSRIVIDSFVFDPKATQGNLHAKIERGGMRFIGGALSKRDGQVRFQAGSATLGIRGGIAKIDYAPNGDLSALLIHGKLDLAINDESYETTRVGTEIRLATSGAVSTALIDARTIKAELDAEARQNLIRKSQPTTRQPSLPLRAKLVEMARNPLDSNMVTRDTEGKLKASATLAKLDPRAAALVNQGALRLNEKGELKPTSRLLDLDPNAREAYEKGFLKIDKNGFLVPATPANAYQNTPKNPTAPIAIDGNATETARLLKENPDLAKLYEKGELIIGEDGKLKPATETYDPVGALAKTAAPDPNTQPLIQDKAYQDALLQTGAFDTQETLALLGRQIGATVFSPDVINSLSPQEFGAALARLSDAEKDALLAAANIAPSSTGAPIDATLRDTFVGETRSEPDVNLVLHIGFMQSGEANPKYNNDSQTIPDQTINGVAIPVRWRPSHTQPNTSQLILSDAGLEMKASIAPRTDSSGRHIQVNEFITTQDEVDHRALAEIGYASRISRHYGGDVVETIGAADFVSASVAQYRPSPATTGINFCDCPAMAVGFWQADNFLDMPHRNHRYDGYGHIAFRPVSPDDARTISGLKATMHGHAIGRVVDTSNRNAIREYDAYGNVRVDIDMARNTHTFSLSDFDSDNQKWSSGAVAVALDANMNYASTNTPNLSVAGQVFVDGNNDASTLGSFALDLTAKHNYSAAGIFVAD